MAGRIVDAVARGCDAVLLDLHGAMVTRAHDDGEGELLARIRRVAPEVPIGVALDMHTNLFPAMGAARHGDRRLPDLSARRHVRDGRCARRAPIFSLLDEKDQADDGVSAIARCCRT